MLDCRFDDVFILDGSGRPGAHGQVGVHRGRIVCALPGSPKALALAVDKILAPILPHATALARGEKHGH